MNHFYIICLIHFIFLVNRWAIALGALACIFVVSTIVLAVLKAESDTDLEICIEERAALMDKCGDETEETTLVPTTVGVPTTPEQPEVRKC